MSFNETRKTRAGMRLAAGLILLITALWLATMWDTEALQASASGALLVGAAIGVVLIGWLVGRWLRRRQRRRILDTRDSALW